MAALDLATLKSYVTGGAPRALTASSVLMDVEHSLIQQRFTEIPFDTQQPIAQVKQKVYQLCGSKPEYQHLTLRTGGRSVALDDDSRTLASYGCVGGTAAASLSQHLHCDDQDPFSLARGGGLDDVSLVPKYVMSDEEYGKRANTYRAFKNKQKEIDPNWRPVHARPRPTTDMGSDSAEAESEEAVCARVHVGDRCEIAPGGRRGAVQFLGSVPELPGTGLWVGVVLDEPLGKHDGQVLGKRYFQCATKHGTFVRADRVKIGDFPELDPFDEDERAAEVADGSADIYEEL